ncbi:DUF2786 domain-containing protein [Nakamurella endophytica]|uniref:DUF2786 domain-containing protein n=1 Tax=Nakamurella endophytica TaxID=1748367 RepID=A0A917SR49_9ACTN|nr:DUF2786 domain-containing protein [Nakamurella endophytica]GGL93441.1 hypothetical protein GCM10011594_11620 [Nakamurella endophytica]
MSDTLSRIALLLRKAESTDNEHEADAYLQAAQRLATTTSVDLAVARAHTAARERRPVPVQRTVEIGEPGRRGLRTHVQLFLAIAQANSVTCDIARNSSRVYAYGFDTDIDAVQALYASLVVQMVRSCDEYVKSGRYAAESSVRTVRVHTARGPRLVRDVRPVHASTARINFQQAFAARIAARLGEATDQARTAAVRADTGTGVAPVLRAKDVELADHYRAHSTARGSWDGLRRTAARADQSRRAGDRAGRRARLGSEPELGGSRPALDRG